MAPPRGAALASESFKLIRRKSSLADLTPELTRKALLEAFAEADADHSGFVDRSELAGVLAKIGVQLQNPADDVEAIFEALDMDGDGTVDVAEFCAKFEPAIKRGGSSMMGKMDLDNIMKETFDKMLGNARDQRTAVNRSFMQAREDCQDWFAKKFLGTKWRMKLFDEFYTNGGKGCASRLAHLQQSLGEATQGKNKWVATALESDADFKREVLDKDGISRFADAWLARLEAEMGEISAKRLQSSASFETGRTLSALPSEEGTRLCSLQESEGAASLAGEFSRLKAVAS
ncbi:hypothetical protein T484DRAFT_1960368 [Baffinella frigidus]|nr:hypothetical protein T484DRAFT_1960367 [Cryptophyta sp. CCMP2293]KAJ1478759.1 hypothetical protein T484DRAFT_1960368 [Cryptophyta sp. CCMP2293]